MTTEQQHLTVDLHGYPVWQAVEIAEQKIKEAWESGCSHVTFIHGSPGIRHHQQARSYGRGGIKGGATRRACLRCVERLGFPSPQSAAPNRGRLDDLGGATEANGAANKFYKERTS